MSGEATLAFWQARFAEFGINAGFVEDLHAQYRQSPHSVEEHWRLYFASLEHGEQGPADSRARSSTRSSPAW